MTETSNKAEKPVGTREWYDFLADLSDVVPIMHLGGRVATRRLLEMCQLGASSYVLDVGCGAGNTACEIAEQYGARVHGIDISEAMIARAEERVRRRGVENLVEFRVADVFELPFDTNTFDLALVESVLTPLPGDKGKAVAEMTRVVQPGGRVAANESTLDPSTPPEFMEMVARHPAIYGHITPDFLRNLFEGAGLRVIELEQTRAKDLPSGFRDLGLGGLISFMFRVYPKILLKLIRDPRFREASRIDDAVTKQGKEYMSYVLIVGQKPGG
jgi:ubiquinone/menaquinone biosynthesis C-methylase UbiE